MGIEEKEMQAKGTYNKFHKIITENFSNFEKEMPSQVQEASRTPNRYDQNRIPLWYRIIKAISTENKERILKSVREKNQITYKGKSMKRIANFSIKSLIAK
jgi:hypothetical protein